MSLADDQVYLLATSLLAYSAAALEEAGFGPACRMGAYPGQIADDSCCNDSLGSDCTGEQLAVTFDRLYLSDPANFPTDILGANTCSVGEPTGDFRVRFSMCVPGLREGGESPTAADLDAAGRLAMMAGFKMLQGACLWCAAYTGSCLIRGITPTGPEGDCLGVEVAVSATIMDTPPTI